jgi:hypothetical protein
MHVPLKPQDVVVILKLAAHPEVKWSYPKLSVDLSMSASEVHSSVQRAARSGLLLANERHTPNRRALLEFLIHGIKYVFPAERGGMTRGLPTAHAAPPLKEQFASGDEPPPVWADHEGTVRGQEFEPLYRSVPKAARVDQRLYELLALVDAVRGGRARERELAVKELRSRLG